MFSNVLTPELAADLVRCARAGMVPKYVALRCGVKPKQLDEWLVLGLSTEAPEIYQEFTKEYLMAESEVADTCHQSINNAALTNAGVAMSYLRLRFPKEYGDDAIPAEDPFDKAVASGEKESRIKAFLRKRDPEFIKLLKSELGDLLKDPEDE